MERDFLHNCSFCGCADDNRNRLIIGPTVSICYRCARGAVDIMEQQEENRLVWLDKDDMKLILDAMNFRVACIGDEFRCEEEVAAYNRLRKKLRKYWTRPRC